MEKKLAIMSGLIQSHIKLKWLLDVDSKSDKLDTPHIPGDFRLRNYEEIHFKNNIRQKSTWDNIFYDVYEIKLDILSGSINNHPSSNTFGAWGKKQLDED